MCGIVGVIGSHNLAVIEAMICAIRHRGPDSQGTFVSVDDDAMFGHSRLAIIDVTEQANQPMSYAQGRFWIVFNGEIYNYREIRNSLELLGYHFRSESDTEVVLAAYAQWRESCVTRFRGMFAFGIWDAFTRSLYLARDRFGIKPLLYAQIRGTFLFASEIRAFLASGLVPASVSHQAVSDYLSYGSVLQPRTILKDVSSLMPGHYLLFERGKVTIEQYWDITQSTQSLVANLQNVGYADAVLMVRKELEVATRFHLISDVPIGAFLSGGVDSTAVVGLMSKYAHDPIKTYSVGFSSKAPGSNELPWAKFASERFGTIHTEIRLSKSDLVESFEDIVLSIDQPSCDGVNSYFVSRATSKDVKVALTGLGGDELFAGYPHFGRLIRQYRLAPEGWGTIGKYLEPVVSVLPGRWRLECQSMASHPRARLAQLRRFTNDDEKYRIMNPQLHDGVGCSEDPNSQAQLLHDMVQTVTYAEIKHYLQNTLLRDADAMSMRYALEVRPILLDHVLAELVFALPQKYKLYSNIAKRILIDALADILPTEISTRKKIGFDLPLTEWVVDGLSNTAKQFFNTRSAQDLFSSNYLIACRDQIDGRRPPQHTLWSHLILLAYIEAHNLSF